MLTKKRFLAYLALASAALIYGAFMPIIKPLLSDLATYHYLFLRYVLALPFAATIFFYAKNRHFFHLKDLPKIIIVEITSLVNLFILYLGLQYSTALSAAITLNTRPIFITLAGLLFLKEREEKHEWLGLFLSALGTTLLITAPLPPQAPSTNQLGIALVVLTNLIACLNVILYKRWHKDKNTLFIPTIHTLLGILLFGAISIYQHPDSLFLPLTNLSTALVIGYVAIAGSIVAYLLNLFGLNSIEASEASLFSYLEPVVYLPLAIVWLKEPVSALQLFGFGLALSGVLIAELMRRRAPVIKPRLHQIHHPHHH